MTNKAFAGIVAGVMTTASVVTGTVLLPMMEADSFGLYDPPDKLTIDWRDDRYTEQYPHRAVFMGAAEDRTSSPQGYAVKFYIVYSKAPVTDLFTFQYQAARGYWGHIRATARDRSQIGNVVEGKPVSVMSHSWDGVRREGESFRTDFFKMEVVSGTGPYYFDFDFYYPCCGNLEVTGAKGVNAPYPYILTCGGGSQSGSSSGGSSSGGGDDSSSGSGDDSSSGSGDDSSSGGGDDSSSGDESSKYPWEDDANIPDFDWGISGEGSYPSGTEDDDGENVEDWSIPEYIPIDPPFTTDDLNIPPMPEMSWPEIEVPIPDLPGIALPIPDPPVLEYEPEASGRWPPPFPGVGN